MIIYCDNKRHLICQPYSVENLHIMANSLGIKQCWFHNKNNRWHYDIPKNRIQEIQKYCIIVTSKQLITIMKSKSVKL